jgi:phage baseplate assembly protein W
MVPEQDGDMLELDIATQPTLTYKLDFETKRISTKIDDFEAVMQAIMKILYTERYSYVIYSGDYGVELERLIGQDYDYIVSDIERIITEALTVDDRVLSISDLEIVKLNKDSAQVTFTVNTIYGSGAVATEVLL